MKLINTATKRRGFKVVAEGRDSQAAVMVLQPGEATAPAPENEHPRAEQWLLVLSGSGRARVEGRRVSLKTGSLLLVEKGEAHQITNTGRAPLVTLNFYAPPAYTRGGVVRRRAKKSRQ